MEKFRTHFKQNIWIYVLFAFSTLLMLVNIRMNIFRYNNFDMGKFDLGNMTQMVWYTMHGKFLYLTDYFGTNLPRWSMSHVDPILALFTPIFFIFPHPLTLVFSQVALVLYSSLIVYKIANLYFESKFTSFLFGVAYLFFPAVGFLTAWTGFHGVTAVIPFFFLGFYTFEKMYIKNSFSTKGYILFWLFMILTMMGKEQLPLYIFMYGLFIWLFRKHLKLGISMMIVGIIWFYMAFFVIIPHYAPLRVEGYEKFARELEVNTSVATDVANENYFLSRYEGFGDSYTDIVKGVIADPKMAVKVIFGGEKLDNFNRTLAPLGYTPILYPAFFVVAGVDFAANYLTTAGGIGTSEIINHRISMIIPVLFISAILFTQFATNTLVLFFQRLENKKRYISMIIVLYMVVCGIYTSLYYDNPVYQWLTQAVQKRLPFTVPVFAYEKEENVLKEDIKLGETFKLAPLDNKDRACALKVIDLIPPEASVSGPDYLGTHLAQRETYAIFPALFNEADYVIVDVFSQKILRILDLDITLVRDVVEEIMKNQNYEMVAGCGNLFVFRDVGPHVKDDKLPLQERFEYDEKVSYEMYSSLTVVDYSFPKEASRGELVKGFITYVKRESETLSDYVLFMTFVNAKDGSTYQVANLPSYSLLQPRDWQKGYYYVEDMEFVFPKYLEPGTYRTFVGMNNNIKNRSIYLGDITLK